MIISKQNLQTVHITKVDNKVPALDTVHIAEDGSTVGIGGKMTIAVSPVKERIKNDLQKILQEKGDSGFTISAETARHVLKSLPADKQFQGRLEHCNIRKINDEECKITMTDGKRSWNITGKIFKKDFLPYKNVIKLAMETSDVGNGKRIVLNLKRFILLLQALEKIAPDSSGDSPVWIEFTPKNYIILRTINMVNDQRAIGVMSSYDSIEGKWLDLDEWERSFLDKEKIRPGNDGKIRHKIRHKKIIKHKK